MSGVNPESPTWKAIEAWAQKQIEDLHWQLEQPLEMQGTFIARGQIIIIRDLLELADDARVAAAREGQPAKPFTPQDYA